MRLKTALPITLTVIIFVVISITVSDLDKASKRLILQNKKPVDSSAITLKNQDILLTLLSKPFHF